MKIAALPIVSESAAEDRLDRRSRLLAGDGSASACNNRALCWPRTAVLGAILLTGYLGGAVAAHVRVSDPVFSHSLFGVYLGIALWGGLWLRDAVRNLLPVS